MSNTTIRISLNSSAGELDSKTIELPADYETKDFQSITRAVIDWLTEEVILLADGDTIRIAELP